MAGDQTDRRDGFSSSVAVKAPVRIATTAAITYPFNGLAAIDGVTPVTGDRVLVKNQGDQTQNGIWVADTANWARAPDADGNSDMVNGTLLYVTSGTANSGLFYHCTSSNPITIGTDNIVFANAALSLAGVSAFMQTLLSAADAATALGILTGANITKTQQQIYNWVTAGGTADAITAAYTPTVAALVDGMELDARAIAANATTTPTFKPDAQAAYVITKSGGLPLAASDIPGANAEFKLRLNLANTRWELMTLPQPPVPITGSFSGRNRLINGDMRIDQINAGAAVSITSGTAVRGPDGWLGIGTSTAGVFSMQQLATGTPPPGYKNYVRFKTTTADATPANGSVYYGSQRIEGVKVVDFQLGAAGAIQFILSAQLRSSLTGTFSGAFRNSAANRSYPWTCAISAANTWTPISVTVAGDITGTWLTDTGLGLEMTLDIGSGATARGAAGAWAASSLLGVTNAVRLISTLNATLDLTAAQIEPGAIATTFETTDFSDMLFRCQRYIRRLGFNTSVFILSARADTASSAEFSHPLSPPMRATPTVGVVGTGALSINDTSVNDNVSAIASNISTPDILSLALTTGGTLTAGKPCNLHFTNSDTGLLILAGL